MISKSIFKNNNRKDSNFSHRLQRTLNWNLSYTTSSLYLYIHPDDLPSLVAAHRDCKSEKESKNIDFDIILLLSFVVPSRQQLVLNVVRLQMNVIPANTCQQSTRKSNGNNCQGIIEQKWIWCDLLATMMQSKTNEENFIILVVEIIGYDERYFVFDGDFEFLIS